MTVIAVLGGSLGSDKINKTIKENIEFLISKKYFHYMAMRKELLQ